MNSKNNCAICGYSFDLPMEQFQDSGKTLYINHLTFGNVCWKCYINMMEDKEKTLELMKHFLRIKEQIAIRHVDDDIIKQHKEKDKSKEITVLVQNGFSSIKTDLDDHYYATYNK